MWVVVAEMRFGLATERLAHRMEPDDEPPLPRTPAGRVDRAAADERFALRRAEVEAAPDDWQGWYRLAEAYDEAGDRRRARAAMRTAIERAGPLTRGRFDRAARSVAPGPARRHRRDDRAWHRADARTTTPAPATSSGCCCTRRA